MTDTHNSRRHRKHLKIRPGKGRAVGLYGAGGVDSDPAPSNPGHLESQTQSRPVTASARKGHTRPRVAKWKLERRRHTPVSSPRRVGSSPGRDSVAAAAPRRRRAGARAAAEVCAARTVRARRRVADRCRPSRAGRWALRKGKRAVWKGKERKGKTRVSSFDSYFSF